MAISYRGGSGTITGGGHNSTQLVITTLTTVFADLVVIFFVCSPSVAGISSITDNSASGGNEWNILAVNNSSLANTTQMAWAIVGDTFTSVTVNYASATEATAVAEVYIGASALVTVANYPSQATQTGVSTSVLSSGQNWPGSGGGTSIPAGVWNLTLGSTQVSTATSSWSATAPNNLRHSLSTPATGGLQTVASVDSTSTLSVGATLSVSEAWQALQAWILPNVVNLESFIGKPKFNPILRM